MPQLIKDACALGNNPGKKREPYPHACCAAPRARKLAIYQIRNQPKMSPLCSHRVSTVDRAAGRDRGSPLSWSRPSRDGGSVAHDVAGQAPLCRLECAICASRQGQPDPHLTAFETEFARFVEFEGTRVAGTALTGTGSASRVC
jgi:hypothetical protein